MESLARSPARLTPHRRKAATERVSSQSRRTSSQVPAVAEPPPKPTPRHLATESGGVAARSLREWPPTPPPSYSQDDSQPKRCEAGTEEP